MGLGQWTPTAKKLSDIDHTVLNQFISWVESDQLSQLAVLLTDEQVQQYAAFMQFSEQTWQVACQDYASSSLETLIKFFTVAEQLPGWSAQKNSPVIWLNRLLNKKGKRLSAEDLLWIKAHSDNQFIPNGSL